MLEKQHRDRVTTTMAKVAPAGEDLRRLEPERAAQDDDRRLLDACPPEPTVSTPVTWDEVDAGAAGDAELKFSFRDVLDRVDGLGDLFEPVLTTKQSLPAR